jgi:multiple sugar transport system permease protein
MALIIPIYIIFSDMHLADSLIGIIIAQTGLNLPFAIWIFNSYFQTIPEALEEAAMIDGCNRLQALIRVVIPIAAPGMAATSAVIFLFSWNDLVIPLFLSASIKTHTLPVILAITASDKMANIPLLCAMAIIVSLPTLLLAAILHKYIISGLTGGALKG